MPWMPWTAIVTNRATCITTATQEQAVLVVIEDTGPGVASDLQWRIFEPFFTTKRAATHVGLGLAMVQEVVNEQRA